MPLRVDLAIGGNMLINYFCHLKTGGKDVTCPYCSMQSDVEWDTEYGEALAGDQDARCPHCYKDFVIYVMLNCPTYRSTKADNQ